MADEQLRIFQIANEAAIKDAHRHTLLFQISPEILYKNSTRSALLNQMAIEVITKPNVEAGAAGGESFYEYAIFIG